MSGAACWRADGTPVGDRRRACTRGCAVRAGLELSRAPDQPNAKAVRCRSGVHFSAWVPAVRSWSHAAPRPGDEPYFLTQITRTTAAFASADSPVALTPFALRKSVPCRPAPAPPARRVRRSRGPRPAPASAARCRRICRRCRARPRRRIRARGAATAPVAVAAELATAALTLLAAAPPPWFCGSAMPVMSSVVLRRLACDVERLQPARAIDAQQREVVLLVLGDPVGIAVAGDRHCEAVVGDLTSVMIAPRR